MIEKTENTKDKRCDENHEASRQSNVSAVGGVGCFFIIISVITIIVCRYFVFQNRKTMEESPFITIFSGGANLSSLGYTFTPPFSNFEILIFILLIIGIGMFLFSLFISLGENSNKKEGQANAASCSKKDKENVKNSEEPLAWKEIILGWGFLLTILLCVIGFIFDLPKWADFVIIFFCIINSIVWLCFIIDIRIENRLKYRNFRKRKKREDDE